ncbi:phage tail tape measure protein [Belliella sp. DSM 107340]|uniref:Phage tail tape measure protein n=1 Tax=Belliella calami TaxID=2923436 RepID=A0ABS9UIV6_9BACT|nr:phage tail tape measure protein [Belliella calami]MCH7396557.1 phage tail tape measure protein [Belliella calami]
MAGKTIAYLNVLLGANSSQLNKALSTAEKDVKRFGQNLSNVGKDLSMKITAPLALIGGASVNTASIFSDSMLKVKALSGATGAEFLKLENKAKELGATTRFSGGEVADAMGYMALAGYNTNQILQSTSSVLALASASSTDLATTSDILTDTMSAYSIEANKASSVADVFATTQAKANTNVLQLGEAFKYVAPNFASAGQSIEDTASLLSVLANNGFKGSMAGTAMNAMLKDLTKNSVDGAIAIGNQSVKIYDANGAMRSAVDIMQDIEGATRGMTQQSKDFALSKLFEERSIKAVNIMLNAGTSELRRYQGLMGEATGSAERMSEEMESGLGGSLRRMKSNLEAIQIVIGDNLAPTIDSLANGVQSITNWFTGLDASTQKNIVTFGLFAGAIPPILFGLGKMITMGVATIAKLKVLSVGMVGATGATTAFGVALSAVIAPVTAVIAVLGALYMAGEYLNKNYGKNKEYADRLNESTTKLNKIKQDSETITKDLSEASKGASKMTEAERKELVKLYNQRIANVKLDLEILKMEHKKQAQMASEITYWEALIEGVKAFGNTTQTVMNIGLKSATKYKDALELPNPIIEETESNLNNLVSELQNIIANEGKIFTPTTTNAEALEAQLKKTKDIVTSLNNELKKIGISSDVLGKSYDNITARVNALSNAMIELRMNGVSKLSDEYINVEKQYKKAFNSNALIEFSKKLQELTLKDHIVRIDFGGKMQNFNLDGIDGDEFAKRIQISGDKAFNASMKVAQKLNEPYKLMKEQQAQFLSEYQNQWTMQMANFISSSVAQLGEGFGNLLVNGKSALEGMGAKILGSFGKFLVQMGSMAIAYGVMQKAIISGFNPVTTIAAGAALVAIGGAMTALAGKAQSSINSGGGSVGSGGSYSSDFFNKRNIGADSNEVEFKIKGDALVGVLNNNSRFRSRF